MQKLGQGRKREGALALIFVRQKAKNAWNVWKALRKRLLHRRGTGDSLTYLAPFMSTYGTVICNCEHARVYL